MKIRIAVLTPLFAALAVALALSCRPAAADDDVFFLVPHPNVDKRVVAVGVGASIGSTVGYFAMRDWKWSGHAHNTTWTAWGVTTAACAVLSPLVAAAVVPERQLTFREVAVLEGSCLIPIVGGLVVNAIWDAHPEWDEKTGAVRTAVAVKKRK